MISAAVIQPHHLCMRWLAAARPAGVVTPSCPPLVCRSIFMQIIEGHLATGFEEEVLDGWPAYVHCLLAAVLGS